MRSFAFATSTTTQTTTLTAAVPPAQLEAMVGTPQPIVEDKGEAPARPAERRTRERWRPIQSAAHLRAELSHSRFLHVAEQGTMLRRSGSRLVVSKKEQVLLDIPAAKLQGVLLYGNVQVSSQCVRNLLEEGVWLAFFSRNGFYRGRLQPPVERGGRLRKRQWTAASDEAFCLAFAKAVVRGKLLAQQQMASAHAKNQLAESLGTAREGIEHGLERLEQAADLAELRGIEGSATRAYFDLFRRWNRSEFTFPGRQKHPSVDPINALLSFGYVMLTTELEGLLEAAGLDPTIGFYHTIGDDRPSLACD
jgi:CRISPR-associated protein Cas1